ncbi:cytochrome c oxidase subunit VII Cox7 [Schizosaccharomyces pombe]|uniref:Cytochrome c oxidase subunit 7 n=1 Tax=Schizosaccharomyces pombe (strain 972 / ATCC 24843) TaxID=284812 RepID=COX7_SCHPO|nr:putative cytochrome c oxidase subunit VII Cox7 [Schizosaccharomyces pombe]G2TRP5.1 RecName: Full=Cytochrome c oxidase subunit 7 [Schizosaccharomyces pombe 972h-]8C8Q_G Chain G, Cytochrome c oxidase subunit 7 [Schizosaccharomyces pombe]8Q1B_g Chain g, Cytochrome c oxidase subunit 7 [Schizosaccharomyces pombe]CCD31364.1 cytochrome c oxidase subunit VII Cox7 (predicted) [Schizosaccharomyces pombe]|eukprot:NP_001343154.1 putative cytochrome c oxidase subunit VII Cox7 [Schizosaccharomyces pombe]
MKNTIVQQQRFLQSIHKPTYLQRPGSFALVYPYYAVMAGLGLYSLYASGRVIFGKKDAF